MEKTEIEIVKQMGFVKCEWAPSKHDLCEKCDVGNKQIYYCRTDYFEQEGIYWCVDCIIAEHKLNEAESAELEQFVLDNIGDENETKRTTTSTGSRDNM